MRIIVTLLLIHFMTFEIICEVTPRAVDTVNMYKEELKIGEVTKGYIRLWRVPGGFGGCKFCVEFNLETAERTFHVYRYKKVEVEKDKLDHEKLKKISQFLESDEWKNMKKNTDLLTFDAQSVVVEEILGGKLKVIHRWLNEDSNITRLRKLLDVPLEERKSRTRRIKWIKFQEKFLKEKHEFMRKLSLRTDSKKKFDDIIVSELDAGRVLEGALQKAAKQYPEEDFSLPAESEWKHISDYYDLLKKVEYIQRRIKMYKMLNRNL